MHTFHTLIEGCFKSHFINRFINIPFSEMIGAVPLTSNETFIMQQLLLPVPLDIIQSLMKYIM